MSCRVRTSDLDSSDFNVPVLSTLSCQSNITCKDVAEKGRCQPSLVDEKGAMGMTETGDWKGFPEVLRNPWFRIFLISQLGGSGSEFTSSLPCPGCWFQHSDLVQSENNPASPSRPAVQSQEYITTLMTRAPGLPLTKLFFPSRICLTGLLLAS